MMRGTSILMLLGAAAMVYATEVLHPILPPSTWASVEGAVDLDEDIYSADMNVSAEFALPMTGGKASLYVDGAFRFLSFSYEYSTKGYVHNYCNLHVNGFNETYVGAKFMPFVNEEADILKGAGLNVGWRFPPGEGSQRNRFHRLNIEPFYAFKFTQRLILGTAFRYNRFFEKNDFAPGDEVGFKASLAWKFWWNESTQSGWIFDQVFLYQNRIHESENLHMDKPYRKMKDDFHGYKMRFDLSRRFSALPISLGLNYEIHEGTLFGFETGHRIGIFLKAGI